jgi:nucleoside-diphosphate-sugar epimerase
LKYMQAYAKTKAMAEMKVSSACNENFMTVLVVPHQVYGPRNNLFLPNLLEAAMSGKLRVFGDGENRIGFTHVDNYCLGLIIAERALYPDSPALGRFYIVTDGKTHPNGEQYLMFWRELDVAVRAMGFVSLWDKARLPRGMLMCLASIWEVLGKILEITMKLNKSGGST